MEYMSREDYCEENCGKENREGYKTCTNCGMLNVPAADVQPVKHGQWLQHSKPDDYFWCCSACKKWIIFAEHDLHKHHFCGNCGARMDGDAE